jgi:hypothetical protein
MATTPFTVPEYIGLCQTRQIVGQIPTKGTGSIR